MSARPGIGRRSVRRQVAALLAALGLVAALSATQSTGATEAAWQDHEHARAATLTAGLATPVQNTCGVSLGALNATWSASPRVSAVPITYSYRVLFLTGGVARDWTSVGSDRSLTISLSLLAIGSYTLEIRADTPTLTSGSLRARVNVLTSLLGNCAWL
ncbi:hypothetical protein [Pseudactinotalea suaedae]|uniref:hypothetical protein n=1 Tax=Pseudactinotalea suaedae TaxID=1524924 RepID=UPI0012E198AB|nr:hypothetical protein [Pseudactinotalea suaedae]